MEHIVIYTNLHKDKDMTVTNRIRDYLTVHGKRCTIRVKEPEWKSRNAADETVWQEEFLPLDADCMIVLGGDGTMLQAARDIKNRNVPLIGVNLGTLGYMTEIEPVNLEESLNRLMEGSFQVESRMMLNGKVISREQRQDDKKFANAQEEDWALNDIVISRRGSLQIIKFNIFVNGQFLNDYSADGVIITTPTGSTGYNLSAGGPIVEPKARLIMVTPICPHTLNQRSIILSPEDVIEIEISQGREGQEQVVEASFDGNHIIPVRTGDRIRIVQSEKTTEIIKLNQVSFLEVLHKKMSES